MLARGTKIRHSIEIRAAAALYENETDDGSAASREEQWHWAQDSRQSLRRDCRNATSVLLKTPNLELFLPGIWLILLAKYGCEDEDIDIVDRFLSHPKTDVQGLSRYPKRHGGPMPISPNISHPLLQRPMATTRYTNI